MSKKKARPRHTKQKQIVSEVLRAAQRPLTVPEMLALAQRTMPTLGIATVYREISRLSEAGEIHAVTLPGDPARYEAAAHHHHHFKCTDCDTVFELEGCPRNIARLAPRGFRHQHHELTLYGLCAGCA